jgi:hypothetical protein
VAEQVAVMRLDRALQHPVMRQKGRPHRVRVCFPPTGRPLNIGEQKRDDPRSLRARVAGIRKWSDVLGRSHIRRRPRRDVLGDLDRAPALHAGNVELGKSASGHLAMIAAENRTD